MLLKNENLNAFRDEVNEVGHAKARPRQCY